MPQFGLSYSGPARRQHDHYITERTLVEKALTQLVPFFYSTIEVAIENNQPIKILDPCAGDDGRWGIKLKSILLDEYIKMYSLWGELNIELTLMDIRETQNENIVQADFLEYDFGNEKFDYIVSNPPYGPNVTYEDKRQPLAEAFVRKGYGLMKPHSIMMYLLNADFETGVDRYNNLWAECPLNYRYVCSRRPSFSNDGKTSGNNYAVYEWIKGFEQPRHKEWTTKLLLHERE